MLREIGLLYFVSLTITSNAFALVPFRSRPSTTSSSMLQTDTTSHDVVTRRAYLTGLSCLVAALPTLAVAAEDTESMYAPKFVQEYSDFSESKSGWSFRDTNPGKGEGAQLGDRVVYDWSGYTIGYFGRPFQAKGGPKGGAFDKDLDFCRTVVGTGGVVKGVEEALVGMKVNGVRQVVIPYGALSYPADDTTHDRVGPKPSTFSGERALNFVLENPRVDRTLLFNLKVIRIDKPNGKGGFLRG